MRRTLRDKLPGGTFTDVPESRKKIMASIRAKGNRSTELRLRGSLVRGRITGWKVHPSSILGTPDFYFPGIKIAIFVDGCFWHGCAKCGHIPRTNRPFWEEKIRANQTHDKKITEMLEAKDIMVVRVWEHELVEDIKQVIENIRCLVKARI